MKTMYEAIIRLLPALKQNLLPIPENAELDERGVPVEPLISDMRMNWFLNDLGHGLKQFEAANPEYDPKRYPERLEKAGVEMSGNSIRSADVSEMDGLTVLALLEGVFALDRTIRDNNQRAWKDPSVRRICEEPVVDIFQDHSIERWLKRLAEIDKDLSWDRSKTNLNIPGIK